MPNVIEKTCAICGDKFKTNSKHETCSPECEKKMFKICPNCGVKVKFKP